MVLGTDIVAILGAAILLFGAERLPKLARSAGEMRREFLRGQSDAEAEALSKTEPSPTTAPTDLATPEAKDHEHHPE